MRNTISLTDQGTFFDLENTARGGRKVKSMLFCFHKNDNDINSAQTAFPEVIIAVRVVKLGKPLVMPTIK